jgi:hypothetical protein
MLDGDKTRFSWSLADEAPDEQASDEVLDALTDACRDACANCFPESAGYQLSLRRLSGALEGASVFVTRGAFRALVSVQRFHRATAERQRAMQLRVVANARAETTALVSCAPARLSGVAAAGAVVASLAPGLLLLGLVGALPPWGQMLALIPALLAWRICVALRLEVPPVREPLPEPRAQTRDDLARWQRLRDALAMHREAVATRFHRRGFRSPSEPVLA